MNSLLTLHRGPDRIDLGLRFGEAIQQGMRRKLFQSCQPGNAETARDEKVPERACRPGRCETLTPSVAYRNAGEMPNDERSGSGFEESSVDPSTVPQEIVSRKVSLFGHRCMLSARFITLQSRVPSVPLRCKGPRVCQPVRAELPRRCFPEPSSITKNRPIGGS
jgi:hypothetical protein